jgi:hypothetical protein
LGIDLCPLDLLDIDEDFLIGPLLKFPLQVLHLRSLFPDDDARPGGEDGDLRLLGLAGSPFNLDLGDPGMVKFFLQIVTDSNIFDEKLRIILLCIPSGIP